MRPADVDRTSEIWSYVPAEHKTEQSGQSNSSLVKDRSHVRVGSRRSPGGIVEDIRDCDDCLASTWSSPKTCPSSCSTTVKRSISAAACEFGAARRESSAKFCSYSSSQ